MEPDDLYPTDSTFFALAEPVQQSVARKKEKAKTLEALPVIKRVITHFDKRIAYRNKLDAIKPTLAKDPELHQKVCEVNSMLVIALREEKAKLEELLEMYAKGK